MCLPAFKRLRFGQVFAHVLYGFLLLCIPLSTVVGSSILQSYFADCQDAERFGGVLFNSKFPLLRFVFNKEPGGHVGNACGSSLGPLSVPVNENIVKVRVGDVAVD